MFLQCTANQFLYKELSGNKLIIFNYSKPTCILFNLIFIMFGLMTFMKMIYLCKDSKFDKKGGRLILFNFFAILGVERGRTNNDKIHSLFHFCFVYLILVMLILSLKKKYSIDKRNLFSIILLISIVIFNILVIGNNAWLLYTGTENYILNIKKHNKWYWYMIFLNIFERKIWKDDD